MLIAVVFENCITQYTTGTCVWIRGVISSMFLCILHQFKDPWVFCISSMTSRHCIPVQVTFQGHIEIMHRVQ